MRKRPSNTMMAVVLGILALFGIYIVGTLLLEARQDADVDEVSAVGGVGIPVGSTHRPPAFQISP
ncbi:MAG: hypothetical protein VKK04_12075 [Synechococcales bacterium]|nr:hypothetical protein [Synechococcales bacterium]